MAMALCRSRLPAFLALAALSAFASAQKVVAWGNNDYGQLNIPAGLTGVVQIAAGVDHAAALKSDGTVVSWGYWGDPPAGLVATQIMGGLSHTLAIRSDGTVAAWGSNANGQCNVPAGLVAIGGAGSGFHSLAIRPDGTVAEWGSNTFGALGVPAGLVATQVGAGFAHSVALRPDGTVVAWGNNNQGQIDVPGGLVAKQIAVGVFDSIALRTDGTVVVWGANNQGQMSVPSWLTGVTQVAAGSYHCLALRKNGTVVAWGGGFSGEQNVPADLTGVLQISAYGEFSLALVAAAHCVLDQASVYAGGAATGTVKLADPAPAGGAVVNLISDDPRVTVPDSVTVPEGQTSRTFPVVTATQFSGERNVTIRTSYNGTATVPAALRVIATSVSASFGAASFTGGAVAQPTLTVGLNQAQPQDETFSLSSSDPTLSVPATVTFPAGQTRVAVPYAAARVATVTNPTVTLSYGGAIVASATVALAPVRATLAFDRASVVGGSTTRPALTVTPSAPMRDGLTISLAGDPALGTLPSVTVPASAANAKVFLPTTALVAVPTTATTSAVMGGRTLGTATITIQPIKAILSFEQTPLLSGESGYGYVTFSAPLAQGATITLASSDLSVMVPASVAINANSRTVLFPITTERVAKDRSVMVTATFQGVAFEATLKLLAVGTLRSLSFASAAAGGTSVPLKVTLARAVTTDTTVALSSADPIVTVPATVTIPAGSLSATVSASVGTVAKVKVVVLAATLNGMSVTRSLKVTP